MQYLHGNPLFFFNGLALNSFLGDIFFVGNYDSFRKIVVVKDNIEPWQDDNGIQYIGVEQFLLEEDYLR